MAPLQVTVKVTISELSNYHTSRNTASINYDILLVISTAL